MLPHTDDAITAITNDEASAGMQRVLTTYAARLTSRLPKTNAGTRQGPATAASSEWHVKMDAEEAAVICSIVSTAEYCQTCMGELARFVAKILTPPLGEKVRKASPEACNGFHPSCVRFATKQDELISKEGLLGVCVTSMTLTWSTSGVCLR